MRQPASGLICVSGIGYDAKTTNKCRIQEKTTALADFSLHSLNYVPQNRENLLSLSHMVRVWFYAKTAVSFAINPLTTG